MNRMQQLAMNLIANSPQVQQRARQNPVLQQGLNAIQNGDSAAGEQLARNLCNSMGMTPEEATKQAANFFGNNR